MSGRLRPNRRRIDRLAPFASVALLGIVTVGRPTDAHGTAELAAASAIIALVVVALLWLPAPRATSVTLIAPALAYLVAMALLRDATGGSRGGVAALMVLPAFATALYGTRAQLGIVIAGMVVALIAPVVFVGGDAYPLSGLRAATLFAAISLIIGLTVQRLVAELRGRERERELLLARLDSLAHTDALTGLANRRAWSQLLDRALSQAGRDGAPVSIALLDLDRFKLVNDAHGHPAGDRLLRAVAASWQAQLRGADVVARWGGDEFAVLLPGCSNAGASTILERLCAATPPGHSCSAGVATWDGLESADRLATRADAALYRAKAAGGGRVHADADADGAQASAPAGRSEAV